MVAPVNDLKVGPSVLGAGVTTIGLDFFVEDEALLEVTISSQSAPLTLGIDYTFAGEGTSSGVVTLTTPANGVDSYSVRLVPTLGRSADVQFRGGFRSETFNDEVDRLWRSIQYLSTQIDSSIFTQDSDLPGRVQSLTDASRIGKVLGFTGTGADFALVTPNEAAFLSIASGWESILAEPKTPFAVVEGATGDNSTDDAPAIQAALDAMFSAGGGTVLLPPGRFVVGSTLTVPGGVTLKGAGAGDATSPRFVTRIVSNHSNDVIQLTGNRARAEDVTITHNGTPTAGEAIQASNVADVEISRVYIVGTYNGVLLSGCNTPRVRQLELIDIIGAYGCQVTGTAGNVTDSFLLFDISGGFVSKTPDAAFRHLILNNYANSGKVIAYRFVGGPYGVECVGGTDDPDDIWFYGGGCDNQTVNGYRFATGQNLFIMNAWCGQAGERGVVFGTGMTGNVVANLRVRGSGEHGIEIAGGEVYHLFSCLVGQNGNDTSDTFSGLLINDAARVFVDGGTFGALEAGGSNQQRYGILCTGTTDEVRVSGADLSGNLTGGFGSSASGTDIEVSGCVGHKTKNMARNASVSLSATTHSIAHGLASTPDFVTVSYATGAQDDRFITDITADATNITFSIFDVSSAALLSTGAHNVNWYAEAFF